MGEHRHRHQIDAGLVLVADHLGHRQPPPLGDRIEDGLRDAVADRRMQLRTVARPDAVNLAGDVSEGSQLATNQQRGDVARNVVLGLRRREHRVAPTRAAVLHRCAVAVSQRPVDAKQHHRDSLAGLTNRPEPRGHRLSYVGEAVVLGAGADGGLVVSEETGPHLLGEYLKDRHVTRPGRGTAARSSRTFGRVATGPHR